MAATAVETSQMENREKFDYDDEVDMDDVTDEEIKALDKRIAELEEDNAKKQEANAKKEKENAKKQENAKKEQENAKKVEENARLKEMLEEIERLRKQKEKETARLKEEEAERKCELRDLTAAAAGEDRMIRRVTKRNKCLLKKLEALKAAGDKEKETSNETPKQEHVLKV